MGQPHDMEMTEERKKRIENILLTLFEDQYGCKLLRFSEKKKEASLPDKTVKL